MPFVMPGMLDSDFTLLYGLDRLLLCRYEVCEFDCDVINGDGYR